MKTSLFTLILGIALFSSARAQFANGDLIMSFQATGGIGSDQTVVANLGAGYSFRDLNSNSPNVINIGSLLSSTYGDDWFDREDLYYCIIGNYAAGASPANPGGLGAPVVNGDARNAIYVGRSKTDNDPTTYNAYSFAASALGGVGTQVQTYNATVATALVSTPAATIPTSANSTIEDFTTPAGNLLINFTAYTADFNQAFSDDVLFTINGIEYQGGMTLQRQNRTDSTSGALSNNIVIPGISAGTGSNEGMFAIRADGQVDYYTANSSGGTPTLDVSPVSLPAFSTTVGTASFYQTFTISGTNLIDNAVVAAPTNFEVSSDGITYSSIVTNAQSGGVIPLTTNYVRVASTATIGSVSGNVSITSVGATAKEIAVSGTVETLYAAWLGTNAPTEENLLKYAIGGATSPTATDGIASVTGLNSTNLTITAIIRTNDPTLTVFGESLTNLTSGVWSSNNVSSVNSTNQSGVPANTARQIFSVSRASDAKKFLRLDVNRTP